MVRTWAVTIVVLAVALAPRASHADDPKIAFEKYTLGNGLEVILAPDKSAPLVAVNVWYHVGSGDETPGKSGFAHLFEHMMFQGTKNTGADAHFKKLRAIGSEEINGTTNPDRTNYYETVPANQLETALWLESERMGHLLDGLDDKQLANQIAVVRNERRQSYDNRPYTRALFALHDALFPGDHPYRYLTIGRHEDLERASVDDVRRFFKTWYVPANATIALVGDFDPAEAKQLVDKWFGSFPASKKPKVVAIATPEIASRQIVVDDSFAKLRQVTFAWHSPARFADGDAELDVLANALAAEGTGSLYKALVYAKPLAQSVRASQDGSTFAGTFDITVTLRGEADLAEVERVVAAEVERVAKQPLAANELTRVVARNEAGAVYRLESVMNRANVLQTYNQFLGDPDRISWDLDRYRKVTPEAVRAAAAQHLTAGHRITVVTQPAAGAK